MEIETDVNSCLKLREMAKLATQVLDQMPQSFQTDYERAFFTIKDAKYCFRTAK